MVSIQHADTVWWNPDLPPDEFRQLGYRVIDMIADYYESLADLPVFPKRTSAQIAGCFAEPLPHEGQSPAGILDEWREKVLPNSTRAGSPRYFGFVNGSGTMLATLTEALAASVNMNAGGWKAGPAATEIERRVTHPRGRSAAGRLKDQNAGVLRPNLLPGRAQLRVPG